MKNEEIKQIFEQDYGKFSLMLDMEIEANELEDIHYYLNKVQYLDGINIPADIKKELLTEALEKVKKAAKVIINKINGTLKSEKFNGKIKKI